MEEPISGPAVLMFIRDKPQATTTALFEHFAPGQDPQFSDSSLALVLNRTLTTLKAAGLISHDVAFDVYHCDPNAARIQTALGLSLQELARSQRPVHQSEIGRVFAAGDRATAALLKRPGYTQGMLRAIYEIAICLQHECYIAVLALVGKVLEATLRFALEAGGVEYPDGVGLAS